MKHILSALALGFALVLGTQQNTAAADDSIRTAAVFVPHQVDLRTLRAKLLSQINEHRVQYHLRPLTSDPILEKAAQFQAEDMALHGVLQHADSFGRSPYARFLSFGGAEGQHSTKYGENVGYLGKDLRDPGDLWYALGRLDAMMMAEQPPNDGHRKDLLSPDFNSVGIGVASGSHGVYLAEDFIGRK